MPEPIPRGGFDQGLFLTHFNKGRELFDARHYDEAERQLEEAYLLRPRDVRVLNLLGLVYFRQEKLERAEEVYRKLIAESPEAHTLHYNLGLICLKLNRLDDAESSFQKALELNEGNAKIHFYLGSIHERQHRYKAAIYQYRQAGASLMVRRVEGKLATAAPAGRGDRPDTRPPGPAPRLGADEAPVGTAKVVLPVSPALLAATPASTAPSGTARFKAFHDTLPLTAVNAATKPPDTARPLLAGGPTVPLPAVRSRPAGEAPPPEPAPPASSSPEADEPPREVFRCLERGLMEIDFSGKVFLKQGTIYSYSGNLTFWVKEKRPGGQAALVIVTGTGRLLLTDHEREITFMQVAEEAVHVEPAHLLACEEGLQPRYVRVGDGDAGVDLVVLEGRGRVALSVASKPLPLTVRPGLPVSVPSGSVIMWTGELVAGVVDDPAVYEVVMPSTAGGGRLLRLEGTGRVLVEQASS